MIVLLRFFVVYKVRCQGSLISRSIQAFDKFVKISWDFSAPTSVIRYARRGLAFTNCITYDAIPPRLAFGCCLAYLLPSIIVNLCHLLSISPVYAGFFSWSPLYWWWLMHRVLSAAAFISCGYSFIHHAIPVLFALSASLFNACKLQCSAIFILSKMTAHART